MFTFKQRAIYKLKTENSGDKYILILNNNCSNIYADGYTKNGPGSKENVERVTILHLKHGFKYALDQKSAAHPTHFVLRSEIYNFLDADYCVKAESIESKKRSEIEIDAEYFSGIENRISEQDHQKILEAILFNLNIK